jgi:hypothetical protein
VCVCVSVALVMDYSVNMSRIISSSLTCLIPPYFSAKSHKFIDSRTDVFENTMRVSIFCTKLSETFLMPKRIQKRTVESVHRCSCKVSVILGKR